VAGVGEKKNACMVTVGTRKGNRPLGRAGRKWEDNLCDLCPD